MVNSKTKGSVRRIKRRRKRKRKIEEARKNPISKFNKLTTKQKGFVEDVALHNMDQTEAALANYNVGSRVNATKIGSEMMRKPSVIAAIQEIYEKEGLTRKRIAKTISRNLDAKKSYIDKKTNQVIETSMDDGRVQLQAAQLGMDVFGDRNRKNLEDNTKLNIHINIKESNEMEQAVKDYLSKKFGHKGNAIEGEIIDENNS